MTSVFSPSSISGTNSDIKLDPKLEAILMIKLLEYLDGDIVVGGHKSEVNEEGTHSGGWP